MCEHFLFMSPLKKSATDRVLKLRVYYCKNSHSSKKSLLLALAQNSRFSLVQFQMLCFQSLQVVSDRCCAPLIRHFTGGIQVLFEILGGVGHVVVFRYPVVQIAELIQQSFVGIQSLGIGNFAARFFRGVLVIQSQRYSGEAPQTNAPQIIQQVNCRRFRCRCVPFSYESIVGGSSGIDPQPQSFPGRSHIRRKVGVTLGKIRRIQLLCIFFFDARCSVVHPRGRVRDARKTLPPRSLRRRCSSDRRFRFLLFVQQPEELPAHVQPF
mmetsp:Transcript_15745/g.36432  ORF Transcript_15745/g.36432 Transcript_15745/m.36432 type:complete len:267 (+) Transcript_15745:184-984(+)